MLRTRFSHLRAMVGVAVLSLALLAGIAGTTQPAEARPNNDIIRACEAVGGSGGFTYTGNGTFYTCKYPNGSTLGCFIHNSGWMSCGMF